MAFLRLNNITLEFPLLHVEQRSLKKTLVARATGGSILKASGKPSVVRALSDISLTISPGERVGLVGPNGAGKTTMLRAMAGIYEPANGAVEVKGKVATLLDVATGMNPELTGWENIELRGLFMGLRKREIAALTDEVEAFSELGEFLNMPVRTYSSGMMLRLAFAMATSVQADILLMDEWVLAGDAAFTAKASERLTQLVQRANILVLASHNDDIIRQWCTRAIFLQHGKVEIDGDVEDVLANYHGRA